MTIEINVQGRFKVLDQPMASPSKCAFCGLGHNQDGTVSFIDTTLDLDFYGVVYICSNCLTEIARSLGYIPPERWQNIVEANWSTRMEIDRVQAENDGLRSGISFLTGHKCPRADARFVNLEDSTGVENDSSDSGTSEGSEPSEPEPNASSSEPGLSDVRGSTKSKPGSAKPSKSAAESDVDAVSDLFDI